LGPAVEGGSGQCPVNFNEGLDDMGDHLTDLSEQSHWSIAIGGGVVRDSSILLVAHAFGYGDMTGLHTSGTWSRRSGFRFCGSCVFSPLALLFEGVNERATLLDFRWDSVFGIHIDAKSLTGRSDAGVDIPGFVSEVRLAA
jgi:hypothetical protein